MSLVNGYSAGATTAGEYGTYGLLVAQSNEVRAQLDTLTEQASTGLVSTVFSGLRGAASTAIDLSGEVTQQQALIGGISSADEKMTLTQSVLGQIGSIASEFYDQVGTLTNADPASVDVVAGAARSALQQLASLLDTQNGANFLFAGTDSGAAPVPDPGDILSSGFYTNINASVTALGANGATATIVATLATAGSNAPGVSPFSAALSQPASALRPLLPTVAIGNQQSVTIGVVASANTAAISQGGSTTGSYIRDLMRSLATMGSLSSSQVDDGGFGALVSDTRASLSSVVGGVADEQGILGEMQNRIDASSALLTNANAALTGQISNIQDVDLASVSTQLSLTQAQLEASYKMIAGIGTDSLLQYLPA
jgi:flagellar hook-associated protein 3 FlgL